MKLLQISQNQTNEQMKKTDIKINKLESMGKRWDNFLGNYGETIEEYFYRSLEKEKTLGKLHFNDIQRNIRKTERSVEYDIILINGDSVGIVEVKSKAHPKDIKPLIIKKINHFKLDYPEYENYKYYFGIATMVTNQEVIKQAQNEGIFLLTQDSNHLMLVNEGYQTF
jgi:Holliday junction resolvase-like predicted endonuclease